ncbi:hypothetical protein ABB37_00186 [Leptomonas pyrrhocoris]|uniref:Uncharacterized protein n=1 Tax=Leptomonas pyrrhocoris TaxID=157538 RepID=A0A0M9G9V9_LEPPY|nr:hypothetical protein ABB37_00186 [Leptomonas pyrrhocoris]KPA85860.1 hypothetical protein ABB37_00186 [Leptomonas pyrrhocoris]|eukprot:XP_015664299.1 hypothetical protein ABB37_00186 [Leptomonas pyrrhocoris]
MSFRRRAPAAKTLSPAQQLGKLCSSFAGNSAFQSHNAMSLLAQLHKNNKTQYDQFVKNATVQHFIPKWAIELSGEAVTATKYNLPLPSHFISPEDTTDDFEPRIFYLEKDVAEVLDNSTKKPNHPRCGHSGLFFAREEVVDNLQAASAELGFSSPFWIHKDHPGLKSGYLQMKDGSESIVISLSASVIGLGDVEAIEEHKLHPSLRGILSRTTSSAGELAIPESVPLGMNALTGAFTRNPFVCKLPNRGLWLSQDQLLHHNIKLSRRIKQAAGAFSLVEIDQWELFNADQLQVPGRLGLRKSLDLRPQQGVFEPV